MLTLADLEAAPAGEKVLDDAGMLWRKSGRLWIAGRVGMNSALLARRSPIPMPICTCPDDTVDDGFAWDCVFCSVFHEWKGLPDRGEFTLYLRSKVVTS